VSLHSYSRCWLHLIWATLKREKLLSKAVAIKLSEYLHDYAKSKAIYMMTNYVNPDHVHALIDLPTGMRIEEVVQLFKGSSSHWINEHGLVSGKFAWGRGYGAFSVSQSNVEEVARYIAGQEEHHRVRSFAEEYRAFVERYGLEFREEDVP
jgi:putative transposase